MTEREQRWTIWRVSWPGLPSPSAWSVGEPAQGVKTDDAAVIELRAACERWEKVVEQHGHRVDQAWGESP